MKVELNIEASQLGETVVELFKNIPQEKKEEMALQIMTKWLQEPHQVERQVADRDIMIQLRKSDEYDWSSGARKYLRDMEDEELRRSDKYRERMRNFKSSKEKMIEEVTKVAVDTYREKSNKLVNEDEKLKEIFEKVAEQIKDDFPKFIHDAMMYWFTNQMSAAMSIAQHSLSESNNSKQLIENINNRIGINY